MKLADELRVTERLFDGVEILALQVFDERHLQHRTIICLTHDDRHFGQAGELRRAPASFPGDELILAPMSDGGPGFLDTVAAVFDGLTTATVQDALGRNVPASWLQTDVAGTRIAVIESAQACGLMRLTRDELDPAVASSYGSIPTARASLLRVPRAAPPAALPGGVTVDYAQPDERRNVRLCCRFGNQR